MWASLINLLGGSVLGVVGGWVTKWMDLKAEQLKFDHELKLKEADAQIMAQEWAARTKVAEIETTGKVELSDSQAFTAAIQAEATRYSAGIRANTGQAWLMFTLDYIRGIVRPALTLFLCAIAAYIYRDLHALVQGMPVDPAFAQGQYMEVQGKLLFMAEAATMFWFGTRVKK